MNESKVLAGLNDEQKKGASIINGPVCANAGPGSGKTRLLTHSIAYRIEQGEEPDSMCAITFTNKAKNEIKERLEGMLGTQVSRKVYVGTYHGFLSLNVLMPNRKHPMIHALGYPEGFVIAEKDDADKILDEAIKEMPPQMKALYDVAELKSRDVKSYMSTHRANGYFAQSYINEFGKANKEALQAFSTIKENLKILSTSADSEYDKSKVLDVVNKHPAILALCKMSAWRSYENRMMRLNALDYDGMMVVAKYLLEKDVRITKGVATEYKHILLDEFQDTNNVQWDCMKLIIDQMKQKNVLVVGDPDQCIYQFRNANPQIMRDFDVLFPGANMTYLRMNYRSTPENVALCNAIKGFINPSNLDHPMKANSKSLTKPVYQFFEDEKQEAGFIIENIKMRLMTGVSPQKMAILYRGKAQKRVIELALTEAQMQYTVVGDVSFYETKEVKDCIAMLRMVATDIDVLGFSRGISASTLAVNGLTMRMAIEKAKEEGKQLTPMRYLYDRFTPKSKSSESSREKMAFWLKLRQLIDDDKSLSETQFIYRWMIDGYRQAGSPLADTMDMDAALKVYNDAKQKGLVNPLFDEDMATARLEFHKGVIERLKAFYNEYYYEKLVKYSEQNDQKAGDHNENRLAERTQNVEQVFTTLLNKLTESQSFDDAVNELVMLTEQDEEVVSENIQLMTIHASKGLEFDTVFIVGTEHRSYFGQQNLSDNAYENEACAFFVAASRAEKMNFITGAKGRTINGQYDRSSEELVYMTKLPKDLVTNLTQGDFSSDQDMGSYSSNINSYEQKPATTFVLPVKADGQVDLQSMLRKM
jgi:DNA helicase II / ATP-dependent DNA helicase PcrA